MIRLSKLAAIVALVTLGLVMLGGCSGATTLDGTAWRLTGWSVNSLNPADFAITARFEDGKISGQSAVNSYSGTYKVGTGSSFGVGPIATTLMAGPEPSMRAETAYLKLLRETETCKVTGTKLTLYDAGGNESLVFMSTE